MKLEAILLLASIVSGEGKKKCRSKSLSVPAKKKCRKRPHSLETALPAITAIPTATPTPCPSSAPVAAPPPKPSPCATSAPVMPPKPLPCATSAPVMPLKPLPVQKPKVVYAASPAPSPAPKPAPKPVYVPKVPAPSTNLSPKAQLKRLVDSTKLPVTGNLQVDCLQAHNIYRNMINLAPMAWSSTLVTAAQRWADTLASRDAFEHSGGSSGENLYQTTNGDTSCAAGIKAWWDEYSLYNGEPIMQGNFHAYGHFTQMAWPKTTQVGCAVRKYKGAYGGYKQNLVCEYMPPGNVKGVKVAYTVKSGAY